MKRYLCFDSTIVKLDTQYPVDWLSNYTIALRRFWIPIHSNSAWRSCLGWWNLETRGLVPDERYVWMLNSESLKIVLVSCEPAPNENWLLSMWMHEVSSWKGWNGGWRRENTFLATENGLRSAMRHDYSRSLFPLRSPNLSLRIPMVLWDFSMDWN